MSSLIDSLNDSEIEHLYRSMTDDDLQNMLYQEKCLSRRQLLRRELRSRKGASSSQVQIQSIANVDRLESETQDTGSTVISNDKDGTQCEVDSSQPQVATKKDLEDLKRELRDTLDVDARRQLRSRIKALESSLSGGVGPGSDGNPHTIINAPRETSSRINALESPLGGGGVGPGSDGNSHTIAITPRETSSRIKEPESPPSVGVGHGSNGNRSTTTIPTTEISSTEHSTMTSKGNVSYVQINSKPSTQISSSSPNGTQVSKPVISKQPNNLPYATIPPSQKESTLQSAHPQNPSVTISVCDQPSVTPNKEEPHTDHTHSSVVPSVVSPQSRGNAISRNEEIVKEGRMPSQITKNYPHRDIKVTELGKVILQLTLDKTDTPKSSVSSWFFRDQSIDEYPRSYFPNLQCTKSTTSEVILQFSDFSTYKHQGRYRVDITTDTRIFMATFDVSEDKKPVGTVDITTRPALTNRMDPRTGGPSDLLSSTRSAEKREKIEQLTDSGTMDNRPQQSKVVSRVSSMRQLFDKVPDTRETRGDTDPIKVGRDGLSLTTNVKRKVAMTTPSDTELEDLINQCLPEPSVSTTSKLPTSSALLGAPSQPERKISQSGILKLIPVMKNKAKIARSSVQQMKEIILLFCQHNVTEYKVRIVEYLNRGLKTDSVFLGLHVSSL